MNPILALILANIIWGAAAPIFKYALTDIPPFTMLFLRFFIASFIFFPFIKKSDIKDLTKQDWVEIIVGSIMGFTIHIGLLFVALERTSSINSSVISIGTPILLFFFAMAFLKEKMHIKVLTGILISAVGVILVIVAPLFLEGPVVNVGSFDGNLMYIGSLFANVFSILLFKRVANKVSSYVLTFLAFAISAVTFFPLMIPELMSWNWSQIGLPGMLGLFYGIFFSSALAYYLHFYGLSKISGEEVGIFGYLNPIITVIIAIPLLHEYPNIYFMVGSVFVFIGMLVSELKLHAHPFHLMTKKHES